MNCRYDSAPDLDTTGAGGQRAVLDAALALRQAGRAFALAIVVETEGSTYRKPGAVALVAEDGRRVGVISGGCLEAGLDMLGHEALRADAPRITVFDTRSDDDLLFGSGSGCRGRMRVLAVPVRPGRPDAAIDAIMAAHQRRENARVELAALAPALFTSGQVEIRSPPTLLAFGAGPEMPPLLRIARTLGWFTCIADHRDGLLAADRIADADEVARGRPQVAWDQLGKTQVDAAVVMTHLADADLEALAVLAQARVPYVGLLGPLARRDELLARLTDAQRDALEGRLHAPVGLRLGGEGPEAIALAIAAELHRTFENR